jgi:hypothetical protein
MPALPRRGDHLIVCGDGPLSYRVTEELTSRYGEHVTVILPDRRQHHGPQISALPRVRVLEYPEQDGQARVLALQAGGAAALDWSPHRGYLLAAGDRLIVLATRRGLRRFLSAH